jgi:hypothetical protein
VHRQVLPENGVVFVVCVHIGAMAFVRKLTWQFNRAYWSEKEEGSEAQG